VNAALDWMPAEAETFSRRHGLKLLAAFAIAALVPRGFRGASAGAAVSLDCYPICNSAITKNALRQLASHCLLGGGASNVAADVGWLVGGTYARLMCALAVDTEAEVGYEECAKDGCGQYGDIIKNGGHIGAVPVPPVPQPSASGCAGCETPGGNGVCTACAAHPEGFCADPHVALCDYCDPAGCGSGTSSG
jgi:hypothetical protein